MVKRGWQVVRYIMAGIGGVTHIYEWEVREQKWTDLVVKHFEKSDEDMW